jgi:hypothetical protein
MHDDNENGCKRDNGQLYEGGPREMRYASTRVDGSGFEFWFWFAHIRTPSKRTSLITFLINQCVGLIIRGFEFFVCKVGIVSHEDSCESTGASGLHRKEMTTAEFSRDFVTAPLEKNDCLMLKRCG